MAHKHSVYDTDTHFSANAVTRALKNESSSKTTLVQGDHNSERFTFAVPRTIEGHDMSQCNEVEVHYINIDTKTKEEIRGLYQVDDMQVSPNGDDFVICSWLIDRHATQLVGSLSFLLRFKCVTDGFIDYAWHTLPYTGIYVSSGINADESFEDDYCDVIERWKDSVLNDLAAEMRIAVDEMKGEVSEWEQAASDNVVAAMTEFSKDWNDTLDVERVRIDEIVAMRTTENVGEYQYSDDYITAKIITNGAVAHISVDIRGLSLEGYESYMFTAIPGTLMPLVTTIIASDDEKVDVRLFGLEVYGSTEAVNVRITNYKNETVTVNCDASGTYPLAFVSIPELADIRAGYGKNGNETTYDVAGGAVRAAQQMALENAEAIEDLKKNGTGGVSIDENGGLVIDIGGVNNG